MGHASSAEEQKEIDMEVASQDSDFLKKVHFRSSESVIEGFCPYRDIYGVHPALFDFDSHGFKVQRSPSSEPTREELEELLNVGLGNLVECMAPAGVAYRSRPMSSSLHDSLQILEEGDQVE